MWLEGHSQALTRPAEPSCPGDTFQTCGLAGGGEASRPWAQLISKHGHGVRVTKVLDREVTANRERGTDLTLGGSDADSRGLGLGASSVWGCKSLLGDAD